MLCGALYISAGDPQDAESTAKLCSTPMAPIPREAHLGEDMIGVSKGNAV